MNIDENSRNQPAGSNSYSQVLKNKVNKEQVENKVYNEQVENKEVKSTWAREMSQISLETQLKLATETAERLEAENSGAETTYKRVGRANKGKKLRMGDSLELHNVDDWPWDESEQDWDGLEDRAARNKIKKQKEHAKKQKKLDKAIKIGKSSIGIGPIKPQSYTYFNNITADFHEAKKMAAVEFLTEYLKYDSNDLSEVDITDTKVSGKNDDILYVVMDSPSKIKDIRRRVADCRNPDIRTRDYVPPIFYDRYMALGRHASNMRENDNTLKTQIRFVNDDIALFTKTKGTDEPFLEADMNDISKRIRLPAIDYAVKWNMKADREPMRRV